MAHTRKTIVNRMIAASGKSKEEIALVLEKTVEHVELIMNGDKRPTPNELAELATICGFKVMFVGKAEELELAPVFPIRNQNRRVAFSGTYDIGITGKRIGLTGKLYGLDDESIGSLIESCGATYYPRFGKKSCDTLIVADTSPYDETKSMRDADRWGYPQIDAEVFRWRYFEASGRDIALYDGKQLA